MAPIISIRNLNKSYAGGFQALKDISLDIERGEILALLGPNGAGKTTLISAICGIVQPTSGSVTVDGHDIGTSWRGARKAIGLVPQEIALEIFETPLSTLAMSRGLFGLKPDPAKLESVLKSLSLWDKRDARNQTLSGGMKRRVMIARALVHEPKVLFLDEPTAGVDVELRKGMWEVVRQLRDEGVTVILTTHYIEEAEMMADRVGVIDQGRLLLVEDKTKLMQKLGQKHLKVTLRQPTGALPRSLDKWNLERSADGLVLTYAYDTQAERLDLGLLLEDLAAAGLELRDLDTQQSSLEEIFVNLVRNAA